MNFKKNIKTTALGDGVLHYDTFLDLNWAISRKTTEGTETIIKPQDYTKLTQTEWAYSPQLPTKK